MLTLQVVQVEDKRIAPSLDAHEDEEPDDAFREEASYMFISSRTTNPIESPREYHGITRDILPCSCNERIQRREHVLVHDMLPADQNLIQEELNKVEAYGEQDSGPVDIVAEASCVLVFLWVICIVLKALLLKVVTLIIIS